MLPFNKSHLSLVIAASAFPVSLAFAADGMSVKCSEEVQKGVISEACAERDARYEEVIVTATKRESSAKDIPINITAVSGEALRQQNITDVKRLIQESVELSAPDSGARFADSVTVRGLNVSSSSANNLEQFIKTTLAYYIDETPLPKLGFRIKDIARVETLLGPQGTLYGAGSLGGTVRYITNDPNLEETEFKLNTAAYQVDGGGISSDTDFVVNVPLSDTFAVRASAAYLDEAGWIDRISNPPWRTGDLAYVGNPNTGQNLYKDDNWQEVTTGKVSALWAPSDTFDIQYTHMMQDQLAHGTRGANRQPISVAYPEWDCDDDTVDCYTPSFSTPYAVNDRTLISPYEEFADKDFSLDVIDLNLDMGFATLTSSTSKFEDSSVGQADYASQGYAYYWWAGFDEYDTDKSAYITFDNTYSGLSHETRLVSAPNDSYEWIVGVYATEQKSKVSFIEFVPTIDEVLGWKTVGRFSDMGYEEDYTNTYTEEALFGEFGYQVTDKLMLTAGIRYFNYEDERNAVILDYTGALPDQDLKSKGGEDGKSFFKLNASYDVSEDVLAYATFSQGFRRGGRNNFRDYGDYEIADQSLSFEPDSIDNYELGLKGYFFDRQLYLQTNIYQIHWNDPQVPRSQAVEFGFPINGTENGPDAMTEGWELSSRYYLNDNWSITYATATTEGRFSETSTHCLYTEGSEPTDYACRTWTDGDLLGGSPKWKHNLGVNFSGELAGYPVWASLRGRYVGATNIDRGDTEYVVEEGSDEVVVTPITAWARSSYSLFNMNAGIQFDNFSAGLWVDNLLNNDPLVSTQRDTALGRRMFTTTPRTIGLSLSYDL
ncbi:TonB-dependent receptor [Microbulbifer elongatus]|uniref:TonB-dependent receptor n=1 Tax=Microbulbifer elongatus TaxID=86173 RepID=UPI001CFE5394|nr:TonB-dependent receptor [Microbulbifer elongatus]